MFQLRQYKRPKRATKSQIIKNSSANDKTISVKTNGMDNSNNNNSMMGVPYMISGVFGVLPGATTRPEVRPNEHESAARNGCPKEFLNN
jgi:hypothetical protein